MVAAVPVLIRWLDRAHFPNIQAGIVDALGGPHGREAAPLLVECFEQYRHSHVRWAIGSALGEMADPSLAPLVPQIAALAEREEFGSDRRSLVEALGRIGTSESIEAALRHVQGEDLGFWALDGIKASGQRVPEEILVRAEAVHADRETAKVIAALRTRNRPACHARSI